VKTNLRIISAVRLITGGTLSVLCLVSDVVWNLQFFYSSILKMLIELLNSFECIEIKWKHSQRTYEVNQ